MHNWTFNTHTYPFIISFYWLEKEDEAELLEEEYEDYDDEELSEPDNESEENTDISDADFYVS